MSTTSVTTSTTSAYTITSGNTLDVLGGGNVAGAKINNGGFLIVNGGTESGAVVSAGAVETVSTGSATGDEIFGTLSTVSPSSASLINEIVESGGKFYEYNSAVVTGTEVLSGGTFYLSGNTSGANSNTTLVSGGTVVLQTAKATLGGTLTFSGGNNTLQVSATTSAGYGDQAVISGFSTTDVIDMVTLASSTALTLSTTTSGGNTVAEVLSGGTIVDTFLFSGTSTYTSNTLSLVADSGGHAEIKYVSSGGPAGTTTSVTTSTSSGTYTETSGNTLLVLNGGGVSAATIDSGAFLIVNGGADAAAVISAGGSETVSAGTATGDQVYGGVTVSGGTVTLEAVHSGGQLTVAAGAAESSATISAGGSATVLGAASGDAIYGTLVTVSGTAGVLTGETIESGGVLTLANANTANNTTVLSGGTFNISGADAGVSGTVLSGGGTLVLASPKATINGALTFAGGGNTLKVTSATTTSAGSWGDQAVISGFSSTDKIDVAVISAAGASLNVVTSGGNEVATVTSGGTSESFIFAGTSAYNNFTLSIASGSSGEAVLEYNPNATALTVPSGTTSNGLTAASGETITVLSGGIVSSTNVQAGGSLVVSGSDHAATISAGGSVTVYGSASGDQIAGGATVNAGGTVTGETVQSGGTLLVNSGGVDSAATISVGGSATVYGSASSDQIAGSATVNAGGAVTSETVEGGGTLLVASGGVDSGSTILASGFETVLGSASGDAIYGTQLVSAGTAVVTGETVYNGGSLDLFLKGGIASATTVTSGGELNVSGAAFASNTVLSGGGTLDLESPKAEATGSLTFAGGGNVLEISGTTSAGYGVLAVISGFSSTDEIDITSTAFTGSALTMSETVSGGNTVVQVISGGATVVETFTFAGATQSGRFELLPDGSGGVDLELLPVSVTTSVTTSTAPGAYTETATNTLLVLNGGSVSSATIADGGFLVVNGGTDNAATISAGGQETISAGNATGDQIHGVANDLGGTVSGETVFSGGQLNVGAGAAASNTVMNGGGVVDLTSPTAALTGSLTFTGGGNTLEASAVAGSGYGDQAVISGFSSSDKIDVTGISATGATLSFSSDGAGHAVATISGAGGSESFVFSDPATYNSGTMSLITDGASGVDLILDTTPVIAFTSLAGSTNAASRMINGTVNTAVDPEAIGSTVSVFEGTTVVGTGTVGANGQWSANVSFLNDKGANTLTASVTDAAGNTGVTSQSLTYNVNTTAAAFAPGNLVISIEGDGDGSGQYADNGAAPLTLEQITTSGTIVSQIVLPQTTTVVNGVTEYAISGEYGSQSEGTLELSADGHSLVIAGYGVNAQTFNSANSSVYGTSALAQSTSVPGGAYTVVPRVIADINADGVIDTSTALENVFNLNNPRSVATVDGTSFYLSGQGVKGDTTQGVSYALDGASSATSINHATDTRTAEIYNGQLYVSADSTQGGGTTNISNYGNLPTSATSPIVLTGLSTSVVVTSANANTVNAADVGQSVNLSPENFFFANANTLYVADGGQPKEGGIGDGGLQKWVFDGTKWSLAYTLSQGLNLVPGTSTSGISGLYGLTGQVVGNSVQLYATSYNVTDIEPTYAYAITDTLNSTTGAGESFTTILTAAPGENIRGIAFAPTAYTPTISGTVAGQATTSEAPLAPFSGVTIADRNSNAVDTLAITFTGGGTLADGAGFTGTSSLSGSNGSYTLSGTAAAITAELDQLSFTPVNGVPNTSVTTTFTLVDTSSAGTTSASDSTATVIDSDPTLAVAIGGTAQEGQTLAANANGSVTTYQWQELVGGSWLDIAGATASTYAVQSTDDGRQIRVTVSDAAGYSATSAATNAILDASGNQPVYETDQGSIIGAGHAQYVYGTASDTVVNNGGTQAVYAGGTANAATINAGGTQIDWGAANTTALDGGSQYVFGTATGTQVNSGTQYVEAGGVADGTTVEAGGAQVVYPDGSVSGTTLAGGTQSVYGVATVDQTTIDAGGVQYLHGAVTNTTINNGGTQAVYADGTATGTTIAAGGTQVDWGTASTTTLDGGNQYVWGSATGTTINSGAQYVGSGATATATTIDGGTERVYTGGTADGVTFGGSSGTLTLDQASELTGAISGFQSGDSIDLSFVSYGSLTTAGYQANSSGPAGGSLTVTDGVNSATLALLGQYAAASFALSSDGNGGTLITEPAQAQSQLVLAHS